MRVAALIWLGIAIAATSVAQGWPMGLGGNSARDGRSSEIGPTSDRLEWEHPGSTLAPLATCDGNLFAAVYVTNIQDPFNGASLQVRDIRNGTLVRTIACPIDDQTRDWRPNVSAFKDGRLYVSRSGNSWATFLYCYNASTGQIVWRSEIRVLEELGESAAFAPDGDLLVNTEFGLAKLNRFNGTTVWLMERDSAAPGSRAAAVSGNRAYLIESGAGGGRLTSFDPITGQRWRTAIIGNSSAFRASPVAVGDLAYVYQNTGVLISLWDEGTSMIEFWRRPVAALSGACPVVDSEGMIYAYGLNGTIEKIHRWTGAVLASSPYMGAWGRPRMAIDRAGRVYLAHGLDSEFRVAAFDSSLNLLWSRPFQAGFAAGPALCSGGLMVVVGQSAMGFRSSTPGDANGDGCTDDLDLAIVLAAFGNTGPPEADFDQNGIVDDADLAVVLSAFGLGC